MNLDELTFLRALGRRIRDRRHALQLTQAELAERCGLHRTFIGSVERGERNIAVLNLRLIAQTLRMPVGQLFENQEPPSGSARSADRQADSS